jgi:hypothetical protein
MKKLLMVLLVMVIFLTQLAAQKSTFLKGDNVINLGIGLGSTLFTGIVTNSVSPTLSASYELGIIDHILDKAVIGVGGYLGYSSYNETTHWKVSNFIIGGRASFHYPLVDKLDTYSGVMFGYNFTAHEWNGTGSEPVSHPSPESFPYAWFVGARYYLSKNFAGMAEVGYGVTYLNLGVALKF